MLLAADDRLEAHLHRLGGLPTVQARLRRCPDVATLLADATTAASGFCGFDRALVVEVEGRTLVAAECDALPDPGSDRLRRMLLREPQALTVGSLELAIVNAVAGEAPTEGSAPSVLAARLGLGHHVIAPLEVDGRALALLVVDRIEPDVEELDRVLVANFAVVLGAVLEQALMRLKLEQVATELRHLTAFTQALMHETLNEALTLPRRGTGGMSFPLLAAVEGASVDAPWEQLLTAQELRVARLLAQGRANREIADDLVVSVETVKSHVQRILRKLGVASRSQAIARMHGSGAS